jgi:hypothetical protein
MIVALKIPATLVLLAAIVGYAWLSYMFFSSSDDVGRGDWQSSYALGLSAAFISLSLIGIGFWLWLT